LKDEMLKKNALQKTNLALLVLLFCGFALLAQTKPPVPEYKIPPEAAAKAKKLYGYDCAMCHGKDGDGKGDMSSDMKNVTDFTNPDALKNRTDGELFYIIRKGKGDDMPPEGDRAKDDDIWNMVNYIRSLAKK